MIIDTSVLIELLEGTTLGNVFFEKILKDPEIQNVYIVPIVETEVKCILCRCLGYEDGLTAANNLLKDFTLCNIDGLTDETAHMKCNFAISLADCYSLAASKVMKVPIYMKMESEIESVLQKILRIVDLRVINDL